MWLEDAVDGDPHFFHAVLVEAANRNQCRLTDRDRAAILRRNDRDRGRGRVGADLVTAGKRLGRRTIVSGQSHRHRSAVEIDQPGLQVALQPYLAHPARECDDRNVAEGLAQHFDVRRAHQAGVEARQVEVQIAARLFLDWIGLGEHAGEQDFRLGRGEDRRVTRHVAGHVFGRELNTDLIIGQADHQIEGRTTDRRRVALATIA